jgi:hypothetical protein
MDKFKRMDTYCTDYLVVFDLSIVKHCHNSKQSEILFYIGDTRCKLKQSEMYSIGRSYFTRI